MDNSKKGFKRLGGSFSIEERHEIIREYLDGKLTKTEIWKNRTGSSDEHGNILRWMRMYGYIEDYKQPRPIFNRTAKESVMGNIYDDLDKAELQQKIQELEKLLKDSKLREEGYRMMIETAENDYNIAIRKKSNTK